MIHYEKHEIIVWINSYFFTIIGICSTSVKANPINASLNTFYDIIYEGNEIVGITKSNFNIEGKKIYPIVYDREDDFSDIEGITDIRNEIVYFIDDEKAIPVRISYIDRVENGLSVEDVLCVNMYNGSNIDYSSIV